MATSRRRSRSEHFVAVRRTLKVPGMLAVLAFFAIYFPDAEDGSGATLSALFILPAAALGMSAVARVRPLPSRSFKEHVRLGGLALILGMALGIGNFLANIGIASLDAAIHLQMSEQFSHFTAWSVVFRDPLLEEIGLRLFLMGGVAWLVSRSTDGRSDGFLVALIVSASFFAVLHILPSGRPTTGLLMHQVLVLVKSGAAGLLFGWVFWRWGLLFSIVCHGAANAAHLFALPLFF